MSRHFWVSALCIGCLISIIRTVPLHPTSTDPLRWKTSLSSILSRQAAANVSISKANATIQRPQILSTKSATKAPERTTFGAYISTNSSQIVPQSTLKVWPSHTDRVKVLEPFVNSIIRRYGDKITTVLRSIPVRAEVAQNADRPIKSAQKLSSRSPAVRRKQEAKGKEMGTTSEAPMELTLPLEYLARAATMKDSFIYTDPPIWMDTRFHFKYQSRQPRLRVESNPAVNYYPDSKKMSSVCRDKSTIIGTDRVTNYLKEHIYQKPYGKRILYNQFRANDTLNTMLMFCHMPTVIPVKAFLDCMIMRHMMMESMVPKYPYHQKQSKL